jgi:hypothetical protein
MKRTYIATTQEAKALHDGTQTAIITKMRVQPNKVDWNPIVVGKNKGWCDEHGRAIPVPYAIGQEVVVREAWQQEANYVDTSIGWGWEATDNYLYKADGNELPNDSMCFSTWRSPATMPVSAARTRFIPVSCEAVRVRDMIFSQRHFLNVTRQGEHEAYIKSKLDQSAWDNNDYIFYYKIEKI